MNSLFDTGLDVNVGIRTMMRLGRDGEGVLIRHDSNGEQELLGALTGI